MPKATEYQIVWTREAGYEVIHGPFRFALKDDETLRYWLAMVTAFSFCNPIGYSMTVRKEGRKGGSGYWYAYKRVGGKVQKKYVGETGKITLAQLETLARQFVEPASPLPPPPPEPEPPPRKPTLRFAKTLDSALHIFGFASIPPTRKALIVRYRELSLQYHPDRGGLHQDMVAVNLAYNYLKPFFDDKR